MIIMNILVTVFFGTLILLSLSKLHKRIRCMGISQDDAVVRLDALTARTDKVLNEFTVVKQALADIRAAQGNAPLKPAVEEALVRAEGAIGRVDDLADDSDPAGSGTTQPAPEPTE